MSIYLILESNKESNMNKVIQTVYTVKALEIMEAMERGNNTKQQEGTEFVPLIYCVVNLVGLFMTAVSAAMIGLIFNLIGPLVLLALFIYTVVSMFYWADGWMDRYYYIRKLHLYEVDEMNLSTSDKKRLVYDVKHRPTNLLLSYVMYFVPHIMWVSFYWFLFGTFTPLP